MSTPAQRARQQKPVTPEQLLKLGEALDNSAREVAYLASHIAAGLSVDRTELAHYFTILQDDVRAIGHALRIKT
jgi:hypothetical protein